MRDDLGQTYEVEMHGQLPQSALHRGDLVQVRTRQQKDPRLPVRLLQVVNLTTMQPLTPRIPTLWSHLGPALLLQAVIGLARRARRRWSPSPAEQSEMRPTRLRIGIGAIAAWRRHAAHWAA